MGLLLCGLTANLRAEDNATAKPAEHEYATAGTFEFGGALSVRWTDRILALTASPSFGYFLRDRFQLSALLDVTYTRLSDDGVTTSSKTASFVVEPSYHSPSRDDVWLLGGLGFGVNYDGEHVRFELIPRVGVNLEVGRSSLVTPSFAVPILIGSGTTAGVAFQVAITTFF